MIEKLLPNLYRIEVPLPGSPLGWVNSYVIKDSKRNLIIDSGLNRKECIDAMLTGLGRIGVDLKKTDFFITHSHADHFALARLLFDDGATVYMNEKDKEYVENRDGWESIADFAALNGFPRHEINFAVSNHPANKYGCSRMPALRAVRDGDIIGCGGYSFVSVATPGHTEGHTCLYDPAGKLLLSGDHILVDITPNIGCWIDGANPLKLYLASLDKVYAMDVDLVLPGHRRILTDCKGRIDELRGHHRDRLEEVIRVLEHGPFSAYETASRMVWDIDCSSWAAFPVPQKWFATGEAVAHLRYLEDQGRVVGQQRDGCRFYSLGG